MSDLYMRPATPADLPEIVAMFADDELGSSRETPATWRRTSRRSSASPRTRASMSSSRSGTAYFVGVLQLSVIPGLSRQGATRSIIEAVRVHRSARGGGLGTALIEWAVEESRRLDCALVQLTSDVSRTDAHRFYERLGFTGSHVGFKKQL